MEPSDPKIHLHFYFGILGSNSWCGWICLTLNLSSESKIVNVGGDSSSEPNIRKSLQWSGSGYKQIWTIHLEWRPVFAYNWWWWQQVCCRATIIVRTEDKPSHSYQKLWRDFPKTKTLNIMMRWDIGLGEDPQYHHANWIWNILKSASSKVTTAHTCIIFFSEFLTLRRNQLEFEKLSLFECQIFEIRSNISHFSEVSGKYQIIFGNKLIQGLEREEG